MPTFTIETTYHLPVYRQRSYAAETVEAACRLAIGDEGWDDENSDIDSSGDTFVTGIWKRSDAADDGEAVPVPDAFNEACQRKAELFDLLLSLLKAAANTTGLSQLEREHWLVRVTDIIARAEAIPNDNAA